jgi:hypothetical protein
MDTPEITNCQWRSRDPTDGMSEALPICSPCKARRASIPVRPTATFCFFARAPRWLGLDAKGQHFLLGAASLSTLGYEHNLAVPAIRLWNETEHIEM